MREYISIGEKATWPHLEHIKHVLKIETEIDTVLKKMQLMAEEGSSDNDRSVDPSAFLVRALSDNDSQRV